MCHQPIAQVLSTPSMVGFDLTTLRLAVQHNMLHHVPTAPQGYNPTGQVERITYHSGFLGTTWGRLRREEREDEEMRREIEEEPAWEDPGEGSGYKEDGESEEERDSEEEDAERVRFDGRERELLHARAVATREAEEYSRSAAYAWGRYRYALSFSNSGAARAWLATWEVRLARERGGEEAIDLRDATSDVQASPVRHETSMQSLLQLPAEMRGQMYQASLEASPPSSTGCQTRNSSRLQRGRFNFTGLVREFARQRRRRDSGSLFDWPLPQDEQTPPESSEEEAEDETSFEDVSLSAEWTQAEINMVFQALSRHVPQAKDNDRDQPPPISPSSEWTQAEVNMVFQALSQYAQYQPPQISPFSEMTQAEVNMVFQALSRYPHHSSLAVDLESEEDDVDVEADDEDSEDQTSQPTSLEERDRDLQIWHEVEDSDGNPFLGKEIKDGLVFGPFGGDGCGGV